MNRIMMPLRALGRQMKTHPKRSLIFGGLALFIIAGATTYAILNLNRHEPEPPVASVPVQPKPQPAPIYYSPLTGLRVKSEAATKQAVTAIMIENSPDARPQSGLKDAGVVYEAIAEGGITRFLTLHQQDKPQIIGPVRSVRPYFIDWLAPYNASVAHVGGSYEALKMVRNGSFRDIDQFFNANSYWRSTDRYAPHNVYTSFKKLDALNKSKGYTTSQFIGFARTDGKAAEKLTASKVTINLSGPLFNTSYSYDKTHNYYKRSMAGVAHKDREKGQITPSVVIAMHVKENTLSDGSHQEITTSGSGKATIFQNGVAMNVIWKKASQKSPLRFVDKTGKDVPLVRGQTWIAAVPDGQGGVSWK